MPRMGVLGLLVMAALAPAAAAQAAPGDLLGNWTGTEQGVFSSMTYSDAHVAVDSQGRLLVAASHDADAGMPPSNDTSQDVHTDVIRLLPGTMTPDPTFNGGAPEHLDIVTGDATSEFAVGIAEGPGGTIWVGASQYVSQINLARLESDGDYDNTFSGDGRVSQLLPGTSFSYPHAMAVDSAGRPVFGGRGGYGGPSRAFLARFTTAGNLDNGFGGDGEVSFVTPAGNGETFGLAVIAGDGVVATGTDGFSTAIAMKVGGNGVPDATWGGGDGFVIAKLGANGALDLSTAWGVAADLAGRVIITGQATMNSGGARFAVMRFEVDGDPDPTWGTGTPDTGVVWLPAFARRGHDIELCGEFAVVSGMGGDPANPGRNGYVIGRLDSTGNADGQFASAGATPGSTGTSFGGDSNGADIALGDGAAYQSGMRVLAGGGINYRPVVAKWDNTPCGALTEPPDEDPDPGTDPGGGGGGGTPTPPAPPPPPPVPPAPPLVRGPAVPAATIANSVTFPSTRRCASRRNFSIRLRVPAGAAVTSAEVLVNGKRAAVRRGTRLRSKVDLRSLPKGRFTVTIRLTLAGGRKISGQRRYRTCAPKRRGARRPRV